MAATLRGDRGVRVGTAAIGSLAGHRHRGRRSTMPPSPWLSARITRLQARSSWTTDPRAAGGNEQVVRGSRAGDVKKLRRRDFARPKTLKQQGCEWTQMSTNTAAVIASSRLPISGATREPPARLLHPRRCPRVVHRRRTRAAACSCERRADVLGFVLVREGRLQSAERAVPTSLRRLSTNLLSA